MNAIIRPLLRGKWAFLAQYCHCKRDVASYFVRTEYSVQTNLNRNLGCTLFPQQTNHHHACTLPTRLRPCHKIALIIKLHHRTLAWQGSVIASRYPDLHSMPHHSNAMTQLYPSLESWMLHGLISSYSSYRQHMSCVTMQSVSQSVTQLFLVSRSILSSFILSWPLLS